MALHVRISNNNLLRLLKLRLMPYAAQVHGEHNLDKNCQRLSSEDLTESDICHGGTQNICHLRDTHMYMRSMHLNFSDNTDIDKCSEYRCVRLSDCTPTHSGHCCHDAHHCDSQMQKKNAAVWPMSLLDVQKLLFSSEYQKMGTACDILDDIFKPIQPTSDDIFYNEVLRRESTNSVTRHDIHYIGDALLRRSNSYSVGLASFEEGVVFCDGSASKTDESKTKKSDKSPGPSEEQLRVVHDYFVNYLPQFFRLKLDFRSCHKDIIFENNYWGKNKIVHGVTAYASELNKIRFLALLKYTRVNMHILKITIHTEDGTVRVRWRISGIPQLRSLFIGRNLFSKGKENDDVWHDGFSVFHVGKDGLIHKHRVDRVMPDEERQVSKATSFATRLAILLGLSPKPSLTDFSSLFMRKPALTVK
ncbi:uncharacterized protein LOC121383149 [Gigantopelta aegis]|uniref:uncharacterized protein LOC121383149 n=1 Tax=Gigantopelta aegis TaxID=1735272 RepID=UPI001B88DDC0|nr:uncharacterized protein LOC121383149 [Gigantopelta aegis]